ncbi:MAG: uroporphyrinogen decarboxylase [Chloroflexi bacterium]|nr:uroporphyrinogen decarboxylase [Chloroflexota bacterium]
MSFISACWRQLTEVTPVWFMRQAGRYMPEYRALRERYSLLEMIRTPELAAQVTLMPRRLGVDALILFADILLPLVPLGLDLEFVPGRGPVLAHPIRTPQDVRDLRPVTVEEDLGFVLETVRLVRGEVDGRVPLIGFAGAPFTLASYMIEGGSSRHYLRTKRFMYEYPDAWHTLMATLAQVTLDYLRAQVQAGAQAVQLFDSWVGALSPHDYRLYVLPYTRLIMEGLADLGVPRIHFATGTAGMLPLIKQAGGDVISVDWRIDLDRAWEILGDDVAVQGNLDPVALLAPRDVLARQVQTILNQAAGRAGHIFNLGHGVLPETDVGSVEFVVEMVHSARSRGEE